MPIYRLPAEPIFPDPELADPSGILAVGGDLSPIRLLTAYVQGIFPWYSAGEPIYWWATNPRFVLFTDELHISKSLAKERRRGTFSLTYDQAFPEVIHHCASAKRPGQDGTWITAEMQQAYITLHKLGIAHSAESWLDGELAGGLYGIQIGKVFYGESMFSLKPNSSKVAFSQLVLNLREQGVRLIDCQAETAYLASFGARFIPFPEFAAILKEDAEPYIQTVMNHDWPRLAVPQTEHN